MYHADPSLNLAVGVVRYILCICEDNLNFSFRSHERKHGIGEKLSFPLFSCICMSERDDVVKQSAGKHAILFSTLLGTGIISLFAFMALFIEV